MSRPTSGSIRSDIDAEIEAIAIIDTHEHIRPFSYWEGKMTLPRLLENSYVSWCFTGVPEDRWEDCSALARKVRTNSYYRWLWESLRRIHGIESMELDRRAYDAVSSGLRETYEDPARWRAILTEQMGIERALLDPYWSVESEDHDREIFSPVLRTNLFLFGYHPDARDHNGNSPYDLARRHGVSIGDLDGYLAFVEHRIRAHRDRGAPAIKSAIAYDRHLRFRERTKDDAARAFGRSPNDVGEDDATAFGDYIFYLLCDLARRYDLTFQVHTGLGKLGGSNPLGLIPVIERFPEVRFALFHGGYPWIHEVGALAHNYPNVYLDLVWLPLISTQAARSALGEWLEVACQTNRITWGGDCWTPEESYGALLAAREVVGSVLAEKVSAGALTLESARTIARGIFRENARELYRIPSR